MVPGLVYILMPSALAFRISIDSLVVVWMM
jgi:hypothetical protein